MNYAVYSLATPESLTEHFWRSDPEWTILAVAALAILVTLACYMITKARPKAEEKKQEPEASKWLSRFRESHDRGELSDEEFRTIKTTLGSELQKELNDKAEKG